MKQGIINGILPFSSVDGPGNRSVVFFQGCNFKCSYCHNPETIGNCNLCGICVKSCPEKALTIKDSKMAWNEQKCVSCDKCIQVCEKHSDPRAQHMTVQEIIDKISETAPFISGVTFSGGECTLQIEFLHDLINAINNMNLSTFVDTNGSTLFSKYPDFVKAVDKFILDIKSFSPWKHSVLTGEDNSNVLKNFKYLSERSKLYEVRTVIAPDMLDNEHTVDCVSKLIAEVNPELRYKLIRCQPHGLDLELMKECPPDDEYMEMLVNKAKDNGCKNIIIT